MKIGEIKVIAQKRGVNPDRMKKAELIRAIQRAEGNFDCFGTASSGECNQHDCLWREDCLRR